MQSMTQFRRERGKSEHIINNTQILKIKTAKINTIKQSITANDKLDKIVASFITKN